jgi:hypothetical protein
MEEGLRMRCANCSEEFNDDNAAITAIEVNGRKKKMTPKLGPEPEEGSSSLFKSTNERNVVVVDNVNNVDEGGGGEGIQLSLVEDGEDERLIHINIIDEKKPYLELATSTSTEGMMSNVEGDDDNYSSTETISISQALGFIFEMPFTKTSGGLFNNMEIQQLVVCVKCGESLRKVYEAFDEFRQLTKESSTVARELGRFLDEEIGKGKVEGIIIKEEEDKKPEQKEKKRKRSTIKSMNDDGKSTTAEETLEVDEKSLFVGMEESDDEIDEGFRKKPVSDRLSEVSSDSNSFSDLEEAIQGKFRQ